MYEFSKVIQGVNGGDLPQNDTVTKNDLVIPEMVSIKEAARRTGLSYYFLRNACLRGEIVHIRAGAKILINFNRLCEYLNTGGVNTNE